MILIAAIENHKNAEIDALCADYVKRCGPMHSVKLELLPAARTPDPETQKAKESETLLKLMKPGDTLILCDERGKAFSSRGFSAYIEKTLSQSRGKIIFAIGGAYGFTEEVRQKYPCIKLSEFVFPHHLARLVLTEQIYRALNITKGTGYHHD
jgi:23S rRNA (pseudouridine1915-N3)-methyltransferase